MREFWFIGRNPGVVGTFISNGLIIVVSGERNLLLPDGCISGVNYWSSNQLPSHRVFYIAFSGKIIQYCDGNKYQIAHVVAQIHSCMCKATQN